MDPVVYEEGFLAVLAVYMAYSVYARLDGRLPIAGALALLVAAAVAEALGNTGSANTLATFVFFLLAAGVVLLLIEHARDERAEGRPPSERGPGPGAVEGEPETDGASTPEAVPRQT